MHARHRRAAAAVHADNAATQQTRKEQSTQQRRRRTTRARRSQQGPHQGRRCCRWVRRRRCRSRCRLSPTQRHHLVMQRGSAHHRWVRQRTRRWRRRCRSRCRQGKQTSPPCAGQMTRDVVGLRAGQMTRDVESASTLLGRSQSHSGSCSPPVGCIHGPHAQDGEQRRERKSADIN